ncbi:MAG: hypothetical protein UE699_06385 [Bacilli bacterium]|nr:hypothetical protein [Bacilli bacterium]
MMKILRSSIVLVMVLLLAGCGSNSSVSSDGVKKCTRTGTVTNGSTEMNYEVYYKGEYVVLLHSTEKIISDSSSVLDTYEEAYKNIFKQYEGLEYYDNKITRSSNSVTNEITINYEKIDMGKLLDIEGEENNVIENGKVKLDTWLSFAKKYGVTCED